MQDSKFVRHFLTKQQQFYELRLKQKCFHETDMAGMASELRLRVSRTTGRGLSPYSRLHIYILSDYIEEFKQ